ncbi:MAG: MASE4 domain-containing protein [Enhydrobacter sp.]|nr:MAG: MASE4 domain-containing protein [Enhydrobacter sp.]
MALAADVDQGLGRSTVFLSLLPPSRTDRRVALAVAVFLVVAFVALVPFAKEPLAPLPPFIPSYQSALLLCDLMTAAVLFGQFSIQRSPGLLILATAYLFTAFAIVPHTLSFPGLFAPGGAIGGGTQTTVWLYMLWHGVFPLMVAAYALTKSADRRLEPARLWIPLAVAGALAAVVAGTLMTTAGHDLLPVLLKPDNTYTTAMYVVITSIWALNIVALAALLARPPHRTLDLWLMVVMVAWIGDVGLSATFNAKRFDVGFYFGRAYGLLAAGFVLMMLLLETRALYARLAGNLAREREAAQRRSRRVFETSQDVILVTDAYGTVVEISPSCTEAIGYAPNELIGRNGMEFVFPGDLEATRQEMREARQNSEARHYSCRYRHKNGRVVTMEWNAVWSEADRLHFFIGRDMTAMEAKEAQLRQAHKMEAVGQLTGGVAHDFNNILMVIQANVEELLEDPSLSAEHRELLASIATSGERAAEMTRRLLAFSRKQRLNPQPTDLTKLVASIDKLLQRTLGQQIRIETILENELWTTDVDRSQLESAIVNLAVNARDAMPEGGQLLIETANVHLDEDYATLNPGVTAGAYVMVAVTDSGTGIPRDILDKVFDPFFTTKETGKGTGLGLSMVYGFIKQSEGHIKIYSEPGRGTTIRMYLPRSDTPLAADPPAPADMPGGRERILLVEDEPHVREAVIRQLRSLGYSVTDAASGRAALDLLESAPFDLLLTDVIMPEMDGVSLTREAAERWPGMKSLFMSGYSERGARSFGLIDGTDRILSKPFRKIDLALRVRETLDA